MQIDAHLSPETLVGYHANHLSAMDDQVVEEHLAVCDECAELSRRVFRLSSAWDRVMTSGMAAELVNRDLAGAAAADAGAVPSEAAGISVGGEAHAGGWLDRLAGKFQGAVLIAMEGAGLAVKSCAGLAGQKAPPTVSNIDALLAPSAAWPFGLRLEAARGIDAAMLAAPERRPFPMESDRQSGIRGLFPDSPLGGDLRLLLGGTRELGPEARHAREPRRAERPGSDKRPAAVVESRSEEKGLLRVAVDSAANCIVVTVDNYPAEPEPLPVVKLLRSNGPAREGTWRVLQTGTGRRDLRAVFEIGEPGEYVVATE